MPGRDPSRPQDSKLARASREDSIQEQRLADPSTSLGFQGEMLQAVCESVDQTGLTATQKLYLKKLAKFGYKGKALAACGLSLSMPYLWRKHQEQGEEFTATEALVVEALVERLEESVDCRAFLGYDVPVYGTLGKPEIEEREIETERDGVVTKVKEVVHRFTGVVGVKREFDSQLAQFRLKALAPDRYADRRKTELTGRDGGPIEIAPVIDRLSGQLAKLAAPVVADQPIEAPTDDE